MTAKDREQLFQHAKGIGEASKLLDAMPALDHIGILQNVLTNAQRNALDADLTEAFHVIFDVKDEAQDPVRYQAYETIQHLSKLMSMLGFTVPNRMDGEGR